MFAVGFVTILLVISWSKTVLGNIHNYTECFQYNLRSYPISCNEGFIILTFYRSGYGSLTTCDFHVSTKPNCESCHSGEYKMEKCSMNTTNCNMTDGDLNNFTPAGPGMSCENYCSTNERIVKITYKCWFPTQPTTQSNNATTTTASITTTISHTYDTYPQSDTRTTSETTTSHASYGSSSTSSSFTTDEPQTTATNTMNGREPKKWQRNQVKWIAGGVVGVILVVVIVVLIVVCCLKRKRRTSRKQPPVSGTLTGVGQLANPLYSGTDDTDVIKSSPPPAYELVADPGPTPSAPPNSDDEFHIPEYGAAGSSPTVPAGAEDVYSQIQKPKADPHDVTIQDNPTYGPFESDKEVKPTRTGDYELAADVLPHGDNTDVSDAYSEVNKPKTDPDDLEVHDNTAYSGFTD